VMVGMRVLSGAVLKRKGAPAPNAPDEP